MQVGPPAQHEPLGGIHQQHDVDRRTGGGYVAVGEGADEAQAMGPGHKDSRRILGPGVHQRDQQPPQRSRDDDKLLVRVCHARLGVRSGDPEANALAEGEHHAAEDDERDQYLEEREAGHAAAIGGRLEAPATRHAPFVPAQSSPLSSLPSSP